MRLESPVTNLAVIVSLAIQIAAWAALALLEIFGGGHELRIWLALQILWPVLITMDAIRTTPGLRRSRLITPIINGLYAVMTGLGIVGSLMTAFQAPSGLVYARLSLLIVLTATYIAIVVLLIRLPPQSSPPAGDEGAT
jgi:hypothetical protein